MKSSPFPRMHTSFYVSDIEKTVAFYNTFFGQEPTKVRPFYAKYILDSPSLIISFIESPDKVNANFGHIGIQVETQDEMYRRFFEAKTKGLELVEEIGVSCCYAKQDKFWVNDPGAKPFVINSLRRFEQNFFAQTNRSVLAQNMRHRQHRGLDR